MRSRFSKFFILLAIFMGILAIPFLIEAIEPQNAHPFTEQKTFNLDFDQKTFNYEQRQLNETGYPYSYIYTYYDAENKTFWIELPKNSTISNSTLKLTGLMYIPNYPLYGLGIPEVQSISIGEFNSSSSGNEMIVSIRSANQNDDTLRLYSNLSGNYTWGYQYPGYTEYIKDTDIGNLTSDLGNELVVAGEIGKTGLSIFNSSGEKIWNDTDTTALSVKIGDVTQDSGNEIIVGKADNNVYLLNSSMNYVWNFSATDDIASVDIGDLSADSGLEIALGSDDTNVYVLNSTGGLLWQKQTNGAVKAIAVGELNSSYSREEIVVGTSNGTLYLLESSNSIIWNYSVTAGGKAIYDIKIGEVFDENPGNEIIFVSEDRNIYIYSSNGTKINDYQIATLGYSVNAVDIGNVTTTDGNNENDILAGTQGGYIHLLNYDAFPTNLNFRVNQTQIWSYSGKFRTSQVIDFNNFTTAIQNYLNGCSDRVCVVPFEVYSSYKGRLQVNDTNVSYTYDAKTDIHNQTVNSWAKTQGIRVNQSVPSKAINVSYTEPALNITITHMKINSGATYCGFKNEEYVTEDIGSDRYCNVTQKGIKIVPGQSPYSYHLLWDDLMEQKIPVYMNESAPYNTSGTDRNLWLKNVTIWSNATEETFIDVIANTSTNDVIAKGDVFLNVTWNGSTYDITPSTLCPNMESMGNGFYACYNDTNGNGVPDFFNWTQPQSSAFYSNVFYQVGGTRNLAPNITSVNVTPSSGLWGQNFNFTAEVEDDENDQINVTLWVYINFTSAWATKGIESLSGSSNASFNVTSNNFWVGIDKYKFEYFDYNASNPSQIYHFPKNTSEYSGPTVQVHNVSLTHVQGNNTNVSREYGETNTTLMVYFNDSTYANWTDKTCNFWITLYDSVNDWGHSESTNATGYCNHIFDPNGSYSVGPQTWYATLNESFYNVTNQQNYTLRVRGDINVSLLQPQSYQNVLRNQSLDFEARIIDEYDVVVDSSSINISDYSCNWYFNNTNIGSSGFNSSGYCSYAWIPNCTYQILGLYWTNVTLSGADSLNYTILDNESSSIIELIDQPLIFITNPLSGSSFYKGTDVTLNATVNDTCDTCYANAYNFTWYVNYPYLIVNLNETSGINRINEPILTTGQEMEQVGINLTSWKTNDTEVLCNGINAPVQVISGNYLDTNSQITFLVNVSASQSKTCYVLHNESNALQNNTISFIDNGGFESGEENGWNCTNCTGTYCICNVTKKGGEENGNYSLDVSAEVGTSYANQTLFYPLSSQYIKIRFKVWGEYDSGAYLKLEAGSGSCDLTPSWGISTDLNLSNAVWNTTVCNNTSFSGANYVKISVKDVGSGGGEIDASHVYIDYICAADSSGNCITFDSGAPLENLKGRENITGILESSTEGQWNIPITKEVGSYTVFANLTGDYYVSRENETYVDIFGIANVSYFNFTSLVEGECEGNLCFTGADLELVCGVIDKNTSQGLYNFTVNFYNDTDYVGSTQTNESGFAEYEWINSTSVAGDHVIKCNISDSPSLYYNVTENQKNFTITFSSSVTNGTLNVTPDYRFVQNLTKQHNDTALFNIIVNNTGIGNMFGIKIVIYNKTGIEGVTNVCSYLANGTNCTGNITFTASRIAELGNNSINVSLQWSNPDPAGPGFENKTVIINATNTTVVNVAENSLNYTIPYGGTSYLPFTTEDFGNTGLYNVTFNLTGGNYSIIRDWIRLNGTQINQTSFSVQRLLENMTNVSVAVPDNSSYMGKSYWAYLTTQVNSSYCDQSYEDCEDSILININVTEQDWRVVPTTLERHLVGLATKFGSFALINVTNLKEFNLTINVTKETNGSQFFNVTLNNSGSTLPLPSSPFIITNLSTAYVNVTYNLTDADENDSGVYYINLSFKNQNSSATPLWVNITRILEISNFEVDIISPNQSTPVGPINIGNVIEIHANATKSENEHISENVTWKIWIGNEDCTVTNYTNVSGTNYDWVINCTAPEIEGNPIKNDLILSGNYTDPLGLSVTFNDTEEDAIIYDDITAPKLWSIEVIPYNKTSPTEVDGDENVHYTLEKGNLTIRVNVTENNGTLPLAWLNISGPNGNTVGNLTQFGGYWNYTYNITNWDSSIIGDYEVIVHFRDYDGNENSSQNYTMKYFDIYRPLQFYSNFTNVRGSPTVNLTFYKPGTDWEIHQNSSKDFNLTAHERNYDIKAELFNQEVKLMNVNLTQTALNQFNDTDNVTNPFRFDYFANDTEQDIGNIELPDTAWKQYRLLGIVVDPKNLSLDSANFTVNYTEALQESSHQYTENDLEAFYCSNWDYETRTCSDGTFSHLDTGLGPYNTSSNVFKFSSTHLSAYVLAESCYPNKCGVSVTTTVAGGGGGTSGGEEKGEGENVTSFEVDTNMDTSLGDLILEQGETREYWLYITNKLEKEIIAQISVTGEIKELVSFSTTRIMVGPKKSEKITAFISVPEDQEVGTYTGTIDIEAEGEKREVPVVLKVVSSAEGMLFLEVSVIKRSLYIEEDLKFQVKLRNLGTEKELKPTLTYLIKDGKTDEVVKQEKENVTVEKLLSFTKRMSLNETGLGEGEHILEVWAEDRGKAVSAMESFELVKPFLATTLGVTLLYTLLILSIVIATLFIRKYYLGWKMSKEATKRYIFPVNMSKIPQKTENAFWIGTIAGSSIKAWLNPDDLTTHVLVAGATGAGKSVGASVIVEEALEQKIPIIVFDPTAQWTGFVRGCKDENLLKFYSKFGMDEKSVKSYKGMIFEMTDPKQKIEFKEFMNPGEITVFTLNRLKPEEFDEAVRNIINSMFEVTWEEATTLKMIVIFDEVHRLLEKYGGKGGYISLEKACREFRKWGIGLIMCSQVLADFKDAVAGNVLTDIQLNTKNLEDINKAKDKYGENYAKRITRQGLGVGMIHNPKYNDGKPYFIQFRPTYHNPHKITNEELEDYREFAEELKEIKNMIEDMKKAGKETFDLQLELKLAEDKLKLGNFRMAKIYITSLKKHLSGGD